MKFILLDIDDTIFDFLKCEKIAVSKTMKHFGIEPTDEMVQLYSKINDMHWKALEKKEITREEVALGRFKVFLNTIGSNVKAMDMRDLYETYLSQEAFYFDGAEEFLARMQKKYVLIAVSNGNKKVQEGRFKKTGIQQYFSYMFVSEDLKVDKPAKEFFDIVFNHVLDFDKKAAIILGDSLTSDMLGGINAGIHTCWYNAKKKTNNSDIKPEYEVSSYEQFEKIIEKI